MATTDSTIDKFEVFLLTLDNKELREAFEAVKSGSEDKDKTIKLLQAKIEDLTNELKELKETNHRFNLARIRNFRGFGE